MYFNIKLLFHSSIFIGLLMIAGCKNTNSSSSTNHNGELGMSNLASQIIMDGKTSILLEDYFMYPSNIDSATSPFADIDLSSNKKELIITPKTTMPVLSVLKIWANNKDHALLLRQSNKQQKNIRFKLADTPSSVAIKGQFNNWVTEAMTATADAYYEKSFHLSPGNYQYKLIVDGKEINDPDNTNIVSNGMGGTNSLLVIPKANPEKLPILFSKKTRGTSIHIGFSNPPTEVFAFIENKRIQTDIREQEIVIQIPDKLATDGRTHLRIWAYNDEGTSNDLLVPLQNGQPLLNASKLTRHDLPAMNMYFTLIDRFNNGKTENDAPIDDDRLRPIQNYMGGDLAGITQKIEDGYFKKMGINTIWLSPLTQNPAEAWQEFPEPRRWYSGYHGYWPISSSKVDERFGNSEDLETLVSTAHKNDMNVLLDYVCNHVHQDHPIYQNHPEWATQLDLPDGTKNIRIWDEHRLTTWFDTFLPTLDLSNPEAIELQADSTLYWIKKYNLDGFRHDATKHIPEAFWRRLTRKLKEEVMLPQNRYVYQIGETYGSHELISQYVGSGMLDAQFDFNLYFTARDAFIKDDESMERAADALMESLDWYGHHHTMGNITGNHDQVRFMSLADGSVLYDEDQREAGFTREVTLKDPKGYLTLSNYFAFVMTIPGIPTILYGDEIGMVGAGDPDNRRMMRFDNLTRFENRTKALVEQLSQLRKNHLCLTYGDFELLKADKNTLAYARNYFGEIAIIVISKGGDRKISLTIPEHLQVNNLRPQFNFGTGSVQDGQFKVGLSGEGFEVFTSW